MSSIWSSTSTFLSSFALAAAALAMVGCGPSPAYYEEPQTPAGYEAPPGVSEPLPSEVLAQQQAGAADGQASVVAQMQAAPAPAPSAADVQIGASADEYADTDPSALTDWRPALENHGSWVDDSTYGTLWVPSQAEVGSDFEPYVTAGHWTYSDTDNWVWVSDYDWGWVPFHYGRWVYLSGPGWAWIPGRVYSGAWVVWRTGPYDYGYVGWAAAPPDWYWYNGVAVGWSFGWYHPRYVYCDREYVYRPHVGSHVIHGGTPGAAPIEAHTRPYVPATPRVIAKPGVGGTGRVVATPSVGGSGRVVATPGVGGRSSGPRPGELGIKQASVVAPPTGDTRLARAQAFAAPSTAKALGATAPAQTRPRHIEPDAVATAPAARFNPSFNGSAASPSVASRIDPVARAPQVQGPRSSSRAMVDSTPFAARSASPGASVSVPRTPPLVDHWQRPTPTPTPTPPTYRSVPTYRSAPTVRATPTYRTPSFSQQPTYRAPSFSQQPTYRAPSFSHSAPSFRPSMPSVRSTPSVSTPSTRHSSSPSRAAPSVSRGGGSRRR
jgi:hypothetical protein